MFAPIPDARATGDTLSHIRQKSANRFTFYKCQPDRQTPTRPLQSIYYFFKGVPPHASALSLCYYNSPAPPNVHLFARHTNLFSLFHAYRPAAYNVYTITPNLSSRCRSTSRRRSLFAKKSTLHRAASSMQVLMSAWLPPLSPLPLQPPTPASVST